MKKFDPNNFVIDKVFGTIDKRMKKSKKVSSVDTKEKVEHENVSGPIVVEVNV